LDGSELNCSGEILITCGKRATVQLAA